MLVEIGKIQSISRELVLFFDQRGDLLNSVSIIKWIGINDGKIKIKTDNGEFEFFVYDVTEINDLGVVTTYTALDKVLTQSGEYNSRLQDIFKLLVNDVLKGCCGGDVVVNVGGAERYTTKLPNALTATYTAIAHGVEWVNNVTVLNTSNFEVDVSVNINQTTQDVTVNSNVNLQNHTIIIS
jgi:hypothetical protein